MITKAERLLNLRETGSFGKKETKVKTRKGNAQLLENSDKNKSEEILENRVIVSTVKTKVGEMVGCIDVEAPTKDSLTDVNVNNLVENTKSFFSHYKNTIEDKSQKLNISFNDDAVKDNNVF